MSVEVNIYSKKILIEVENLLHIHVARVEETRDKKRQ